MHRLTYAIVLLAVTVVPAAPSFAAAFPDVPDGHIYQEPIETLVSSGVVSGNPDGKFYPDRQVNRAEMLKMLYLAKGQVPDPTSKDCFSDVAAGSWYESFVCDAAAKGYVQGYGDRTFRPGNPVNRVEALKMIFTVLNLGTPEITEEDRQLIKFVDVSVAAWYSKYLATAFKNGILPIPGQEGARFYPEWPLLRGEAAAYIVNALSVTLEEARAAVSSARSSSAAQASDAQAPADDFSFDKPFPFSAEGKFTERNAITYRFTVEKDTLVKTVVELQNGQPGNVSCRMYLLDEDGFSTEYYLGYQSQDTCTLKTALQAGNYQLQIQPTYADTTFSVAMTETTGDRNDGFREALALLRNVPKTATLIAEDYQDWYTFTISEEVSRIVTLNNTGEVSCMIYSADDVDLFGFQNPTCNQNFSYPAGTYTVAVTRKAIPSAQVTYTIVLQ